jgi:protein-S-isoprenylcysteine O-methyltransferase Ste14
VGLLGTALAINLYYLIAMAAVTGYFVFSANVEERNMTDAFPDQYPEYKAHTKMLLPFVL